MASQGPRYPGTVANQSVAPENTDAWVNPGNVSTDDNGEAQITAASFDSPDISQRLRCSNFGFTIPTGATIDGIIVEIERRSIIANSGVDNRVQLQDAAGALVGNNKATATVWPTALTVATYGSSSDKWGWTLVTPADINDVDFGVVVSAKANIANADIGVDFVRVTVHYTSVTDISDNGTVTVVGVASALEALVDAGSNIIMSSQSAAEALFDSGIGVVQVAENGDEYLYDAGTVTINTSQSGDHAVIEDIFDSGTVTATFTLTGTEAAADAGDVTVVVQQPPGDETIADAGRVDAQVSSAAEDALAEIGRAEVTVAATDDDAIVDSGTVTIQPDAGGEGEVEDAPLPPEMIGGGGTTIEIHLPIKAKVIRMSGTVLIRVITSGTGEVVGVPDVVDSGTVSIGVGFSGTQDSVPGSAEQEAAEIVRQELERMIQEEDDLFASGSLL